MLLAFCPNDEPERPLRVEVAGTRHEFRMIGVFE